ncbi:hypothetical protein CR513_62447, partial [Mucuna pruriens]
MESASEAFMQSWPRETGVGLIMSEMVDTYCELYGKEKVLEQMGGNKGLTQMWVNQTTSDKENVVEPRSTSQLD